MAVDEQQQEQESEVVVVINMLGEKAPLWQLLDQLGVPDGGDFAEITSQVAGLQGQVEQVKADFQARIDEIREQIGAPEPTAAAAKAKPKPTGRGR
jgi:ABC-type Fe3+-hydroxamate transport system substrate-binding protein